MIDCGLYVASGLRCTTNVQTFDQQLLDPLRGTPYRLNFVVHPLTDGFLVVLKHFITSAKEVMFSSLFVCLPVCLFVSNFAQKLCNKFV